MKPSHKHQSTTALARHGVRRRARFGALAMLTLAMLCAAVPALMLGWGPSLAAALALPIAILVCGAIMFLGAGDQMDGGIAAGLRAAHAAGAERAAGLRLSKAIFAALGAIGAAPAQARARAMLPPSPRVGTRPLADLNLTPRLLGQRPTLPASIAGVMW